MNWKLYNSFLNPLPPPKKKVQAPEHVCKKKSAGNDFQAIYLGIRRNAEYVRLGVELKEHNVLTA
jgi:hypothetical protein